MITGTTATETCNKLNLGAGLGSGIEGDVHTTLDEYSKDRYPPAAYQSLLAGRVAREKGMRGAGKGEWEEEERCTAKEWRKAPGMD